MKGKGKSINKCRKLPLLDILEEKMPCSSSIVKVSLVSGTLDISCDPLTDENGTKRATYAEDEADEPANVIEHHRSGRA